jgi:hypothetical protein
MKDVSMETLERHWLSIMHMPSPPLRTAFFAVCILFLAVGVPSAAAADESKVRPDCTLNGFKLYGKIKVVNAFPDLKVQIVEAFPDLKVQMVDAFPDKCGQWKVVESFPDLKIQFVEAFPDLKIKYVSAFPGLP